MFGCCRGCAYSPTYSGCRGRPSEGRCVLAVGRQETTPTPSRRPRHLSGNSRALSVVRDVACVPACSHDAGCANIASRSAMATAPVGTGPAGIAHLSPPEANSPGAGRSAPLPAPSATPKLCPLEAHECVARQIRCPAHVFRGRQFLDYAPQRHKDPKEAGRRQVARVWPRSGGCPTGQLSDVVSPVIHFGAERHTLLCAFVPVRFGE